LSDRLEANAIILDTGVRNCDEPNTLVAGADVGNVDTKHFQTILKLFQGEVILVQHDWVSLLIGRSKFTGVCQRLEANAIILGARIVNGDKPDFSAANTDVRDVDAEGFQTIL
jgi:hypothetical protein